MYAARRLRSYEFKYYFFICKLLQKFFVEYVKNIY